MFSFEFFYRFLLSKRAGSLVKSISTISIVGIWLGVSALIIVVSVMNGFNRSIQKKHLEVESHLVVEFDELKSGAEWRSHAIIEKLNKEEVEFLSPRAKQDIILRTAEGMIQPAIAYGVTRERLLRLFKYSFLRLGDTDDPNIAEDIQAMKPGEVVVGIGLADTTGLFEDYDVVLIPPETFLLPPSEIPQLAQATVRGIVQVDLARIDNSGLFYILNESFPRLIESPGRSLGLEVWLKDPSQTEVVRDRIQTEGVKITTWQERNASLYFALRMEKMVVSFLVGLSTLIAGLSIISVMVLLLTQKRKDIGNLLAMGMTPLQVRNTFLGVGMNLALAGVVLGVLTGMLASFAIDRYSHNVLPAFYQETNIPADIYPSQVLIILAVALIFSGLSLWVTLRKMASYRPSEILRS